MSGDFAGVRRTPHNHDTVFQSPWTWLVPLVGALLKNEQDVTLFEKLVFMQRNNR